MDSLIWALRHPDGDRALVAAQTLGRLRAHEAIPALHEAVEAGSDIYVRAQALAALSRSREWNHCTCGWMAKPRCPFNVRGIAREALDDSFRWLSGDLQARRTKFLSHLGSTLERLLRSVVGGTQAGLQPVFLAVLPQTRESAAARAPDSDPGSELQPAAERHRRGDRPERGRQDHLAEDNPRLGAAGCRDDQSGETVGSPMWISCGPGSAGRDRAGGDLRRRGLDPRRGGPRSSPAPAWPRSGSKNRTTETHGADVSAGSGAG